MKKFIIKSWPKFLGFIMELSSIVGGVILTNHLATIKFFTQIFLKSPPKDEIYAIDLAINILISKALIFCVYSLIALVCQILFCSNEINLTFEDKNKKTRDKIEYSFKQSVTKVFIRVYVKGNPKRLRNCKIELNLPVNVSVESLKPNKKLASTIKDKKTVIIDINELDLTKRKWADSFTLEMIILKSEENINSDIEVVYNPKIFIGGKRTNNIGWLGE
ncbi:hypothetical protein BJG88_08565 [Staphylococcus nepalensis]|nr:hypothetical protein BJG88_08565 [Staphylococcus nepalensis]